MTTSRAASSTMPLCARRSVYSAAKRSRRSSSVGSRTFAPHRSTPSRDAAPRTASSGPSSVSSTTRRRSSVSAARSTRSSVPSGSTMCFLASRARSSSVYSNISGVTASERATSKRSSRSSPSTWSSNTASALVILRGVSRAIAPSRAPARTAVSNVPCRVSTTGSIVGKPSSGRRIVSGGRSPPVSTIPAGEGSTDDACANSAASTTSARSPGVISTAPSSMRSIRFGSVIAATVRCSASRPSSSASPAITSPSQAAATWPTVGAISRSISGSA